MTPKELRIGNWIHTVNGYEQVCDVLCDSVNTMTLQNEIYDNISGIELTEAIFYNIQLVKRNNGYLPVRDRLDFWHTKEGVFLELDIDAGEFSLTRQINDEPIEFVHELQNWFYFASGGKELEITL